MGTAVETAAVTWFRENGFPEAERIALSGSLDRGDIRLVRDPLVVVECKRGKQGIKLTPWMNELRREIVNAGAELGLLLSDQPGAGTRRVNRWFAAMDYNLFAKARGGDLFSNPEYRWLDSWSPVKINSEYVPMLAAGGKSLSSYWTDSPFALTYTPGHRDVLMVCGPLEQFSQVILEWAERRRDN